jgi:putative ABC transport system ATP-binding protein
MSDLGVAIARGDAGPAAAGCVRVRHLNHHFGEGEIRTEVLRDVHLDLDPGRIVIMTGRSGSGKTTLLTLIGALRRVQEGSVRVLGRELRGLDDQGLVAVRRGIGFIFQAHNLFASLTAYQNVRMALELEALPAEEMDHRITAILADLELEDRMHHKPAKLSGGQRQRVAIARALVHRPRLLLADEPTAALDEESSRIAVDLLRQTALRDRTSILIVTHDNTIMDVADRVLNISYGRIV